MADPVDVERTVGGWIVASIVTAVVTLWGVRYAHRKEVESERAREDIVGLYRPLRNEMERILEERYKIGKGWPIWSPSDEFNDVLRRGLLRPARHDGLRGEIESLVKLHGEHMEARTSYYDSVVETLDTVFQSAKMNAVGGEERPLRSVIGLDFRDDRFHLAIAGDVDGWIDMLKQLQGNADAANARVQWRTMIPTTEELFYEIQNQTSDAYRAYQGSANALLTQATKISDILDRAIREAG